MSGELPIKFKVVDDQIIVRMGYDKRLYAKFSEIPMGWRKFDQKRGVWVFGIGMAKRLSEYIPVTEAVMEEYRRYVDRQADESEKPDFVITVGPSYATLVKNKPFAFDPEPIVEACSFEVPNSNYTSAFQSGNWDGFYRLYNQKKSTFPSGLLDAVLRALDVEYYTHEVRYDHRAIKTHSIKFVSTASLRDYQTEAADAAYEETRGILQLATGAGKTVLASGVIERFGVRTLFLVHTKDLLYQAHQVFSAIFPETAVGIIGDGQKKVGDITVATIQTIAPHISYDDDLFGDVDYDIDQEYDEDDAVIIKQEKRTDISDYEVMNYLKEVDLVIFDECLVGDTLISMADGGLKKIADVKNGDVVVGGVVSNCFSKVVKRTLVIETGFARLETTDTHPHFTVGNLYLNNNVYQDSNVGVVNASELTVGNYLLVPHFVLGGESDETNNHYVQYNGVKYLLSKIISIRENVADVAVYDFTTTDSNFIANGFLTHNCQHLPCKSFYKIAMRLSTPFKFGLSATPWRDDNFQMKIEAGIGRIIYKKSASDLIREGYLVKPHIKFIDVPPMGFPRKAAYRTVESKYIVDNETRNLAIAQIASDEAGRGRQVLVLVKYIRHLNVLAKMIAGAEKVDGGMRAGKRADIIRRFKKKEIRILVATTIADEGLDVPTLEVLVLAGGGRSSTKALQRIGRAIRLSDECPHCESTRVGIKSRNDPCHCHDCGHNWAYRGKSEAIIYDFVDNVKWLYNHYLKRKTVYEGEAEFRITRHRLKIE